MTDAITLQILQNLNLIEAERLYLNAHAERRAILAEEKYANPKRLSRFGAKNYSQCDEDGLIAEIIRRLGDRMPKSFVEFGVESGVECNTLRLLAGGWPGLWLEGSSKYCAAMQQSHANYLADKRLKVQNAFITRENINELLAVNGYGDELGLISIDIDGNDIWIWQALKVRPALVVIEYNASWAPPLSVAQPYQADNVWRGTSYFGASLTALVKVGREKGYNLVGCSLSGANAFFVRDDLCGDLFHAPYTAEEHYEPARYFLRFIKAGHPSGIGPLVTV